mmetsp:Transcript_34513/g.63686  ORF Transcript_34513/g.63686 Transcript_34513/m.63686 type:complete len:168 (+) Transcript_34513:124-627(+)
MLSLPLFSSAIRRQCCIESLILKLQLLRLSPSSSSSSSSCVYAKNSSSISVPTSAIARHRTHCSTRHSCHNNRGHTTKLLCHNRGHIKNMHQYQSNKNGIAFIATSSVKKRQHRYLQTQTSKSINYNQQNNNIQFIHKRLLSSTLSSPPSSSSSSSSSGSDFAVSGS